MHDPVSIVEMTLLADHRAAYFEAVSELFEDFFGEAASPRHALYFDPRDPNHCIITHYWRGAQEEQRFDASQKVRDFKLATAGAFDKSPIQRSFAYVAEQDEVATAPARQISERISSAVTALFRVQVSEDEVRPVIETLDHVARLSREEPGCQAYDFYLSPNERGTLVLLQDWYALSDYEDHLAKPYVRDMFARHLHALIEKPKRFFLTDVKEWAAL